MQIVNKNLMAPFNGNNIIFMFDDINMSQKDKWGDIPSNELIR